MKKGFTLLETLLSLILLAIVTSGFLKLSTAKSSHEAYYFLNNYKNFSSVSNYSYEINGNKDAEITLTNSGQYKKITYKNNEGFALVRYTLQK